MGTMTIALAEHILDVVYTAMEDANHLHRPISKLRGFDASQTCIAGKLLIANEYLILSRNANLKTRDDFDQRFTGSVKHYGELPWIIQLNFVPDEKVDDPHAKSALEVYDSSTNSLNSRFASQETANSFGDFCKFLGANDPLYWQKVFTRLDLEYTSASPRENNPVNPKCNIDDPNIVGHYFDIVTTFAGFLDQNPASLVGDCDFLPHPKKTILYAIQWLNNHYADTRERFAEDEEYIELTSSLSFLLTVLCDRWHRIDPTDKEAISKLQGLDSFPNWAIPLRDKYIDKDKARDEAMDAAHEALMDRTRN